jgi:predicted alpha/beta-fold hydrolase
VLLFFTTPLWAQTGQYDYPIKNPYIATVVGTPTSLKAILPKEKDIRSKEYELTVFPDREVPDVFWYTDTLKFSLAYQKNKAPLIFNIAGTGSSYESGKMRMMQRAFYKAGFHVISLTSPTHPNFIINASKKRVPGLLTEDSKDLYRVMKLAYDKVKSQVDVSEFYLTGFSLGGTQAAFVAKLDEQKKLFNFKKILMLNPSVNLMHSLQILDDLLVDNIPGGTDNFGQYFDEFFADLAKAYRDNQHVDFSDDDFLYALYQRSRENIRLDRVKVLIGMVFRLGSTDMVFTADVMSHFGYVVPRRLELERYDSLTPFFKVNNRFGLVDYYNDFLFPFYNRRKNGISREEIVKHYSLQGIEGYLKRSGKIAVMHNEDDIILKPGEIDYLKKVFGNRARIYPRGGHGGNLDHRVNIKHMLDFFLKN